MCLHGVECLNLKQEGWANRKGEISIELYFILRFFHSTIFIKCDHQSRYSYRTFSFVGCFNRDILKKERCKEWERKMGLFQYYLFP